MTQVAKLFDPVLGIDIHLVVIPPSPAPVPMPHPFIGVVFDPIGAAIGAAIGYVTGGGGPVLINMLPVGNTGTSVRGVPHFPIGASFHPSDVPGNDGTIVTGSKTVSMAGSSAGRLGSLVTSCNFPINLPTSLCLAVPMGAPVIVGGPDSFDVMAAVTQGIRTKWVSGKLHGLLRAKPGSRLSKLICFLTGHPVDVMTGAVLTEAVDFTLPGPLPLRFSRDYYSRDPRAGALGQGWSHNLEAAVHDVGTHLVVQLEDGRPVPHPQLAPGGSDRDPVERHTLTRTGERTYSLALADGRTLDFAAVVEAPSTYPLVRVRDANDNAIALTHAGGRLASITDSAGRLLRLRHDDAGRLLAVRHLPGGREGERALDLVRFAYDDHGQLAAVHDALGQPFTYAYRGGVLVRETNRNGLAFHFEYDWDHPDGWCIRTWGDGGLYGRTLTYDKHRHVTAVDDSRGGRTHYFGNAVGLVDRILDAEGGEWSYEWHPEQLRKTAEVDPLGHRSTWEYDARGNLVCFTDALGHRTRWRHDERGLPIEKIDPRGHTWTREHDARGNLVRASDPCGATYQYHHDRRGLVIGARDPLGRSVELTFDAAGQVVATTDREGHTTRHAYDELGRLVERIGPLGGRLRLRWDACGRLVASEQPDGSRTSQEYDPEGNLVRRVDGLGNVWTYTHVGLGKLHSAQDPLGGRITYAHDSEEDLIAVRNEHDELHSFTYDRRGAVTREVSFDGRARMYQYDRAGRRIAIVDGRDRTARISHDALGRVIQWSGHDGAWLRFAYDPAGDLIEASNEVCAVRLERDACGRVIRDLTRDHGVEIAHDLLGNRTRRTTSVGHETRYEFDGRGDPRRITVPGRATTPRDWTLEISRDADGLETGRRLPGGIESLSQYDATGHLTLRRIIRHPRAPMSTRTGPEELSRTVHEWRAEDRLVARHDERGTTAYTHDARGALIAAALPDGGVIHRAMDLVGNIYRSPARTDRRYGAGGRLLAADGVTFTYDADGNTIRRRAADGATWEYRWDGHGRLREVQRPDGGLVRFTYDAFARRLAKEVRGPDGGLVRRTAFVWDGPHVVHELDSITGRTDWDWQAGSFTPVLRVRGDQRWSVISDHLGTPTAMFDEAGELVWQMRLGIDGEPEFTAGAATDCPWRWPGQYADEETGLLYNNYRYFDGERYLSPDPLGLAGGLAPYAYVSDPMTWVDPLGLAGAMLGKGGTCKDKISELPDEFNKKQESAIGGTVRLLANKERPADPFRQKMWGEQYHNKNGALLPPPAGFSYFEHRVRIDGTEDLHRVVTLAPMKDKNSPTKYFYTATHYDDYFEIPKSFVDDWK